MSYTLLNLSNFLYTRLLEHGIAGTLSLMTAYILIQGEHCLYLSSEKEDALLSILIYKYIRYVIHTQSGNNEYNMVSRANNSLHIVGSRRYIKNSHEQHFKTNYNSPRSTFP